MGSLSLAQPLPPPALTHRPPCLLAHPAERSCLRAFEEAAATGSAAVWGPLDSHYPVWVAAPWSPSAQPKGLRTEGKEHEAGLRGHSAWKGTVGSLPLVSGGRNSEEAGGAWGRAACCGQPVLPSSLPRGVLPSFFPSILPSLILPSTAHPPSMCLVTHSLGLKHLLPTPIHLPTFIPSSTIPLSSGLACGVTRLGCCGPECCSPEGTPEKTSAHRGAREVVSPGRAVAPGLSVGQSWARALWGSEGSPGGMFPS